MDPGEPGILSGAPASRSVLRVTQQELANYYDFKKQALENGGFIIAGGIYLDLQKRGSFLAAVAGKTKVLIYYPGKKQGLPGEPNEPNAMQGSQDQEKISQDNVREKIDQLYREYQIAQDPLEKERLMEQILLLTMALNALMTGMKIPEFLVGMLLNTLA